MRVIELRREIFRPSRALILHSRTLEALRPLGVTQPLLARADIAPTADLHVGSRVVRGRLADLALPDTAFPHLSLIRQMDVETVLVQALADRGIEVERGTELAGVHHGPEGVRAVLRLFWGEAATGRIPALLRRPSGAACGSGHPRGDETPPPGRRGGPGAVAVAGELPRQPAVGGGNAAAQPRTPCRDRLPDQTVTSAGHSIRLHELLAQAGVRVLMDRDADPLGTMQLGPLVHIHRITSRPGRGLFTARPDGYIGLRCQVAEATGSPPGPT